MISSNGIWDQINKLEPVQVESFTDEYLTKALMEASAKTTENMMCPVYLDYDASDLLWDIVHGKWGINVYGIKQIADLDGAFIYEGVLFDKFPEKYTTLYIDYKGEICEEIIPIILTDTRIVFPLSFKLPDSVTQFTIQWY